MAASYDLVPTLVLGEQEADNIVAVCGTGTGFGARARDGRSRRASGQEFLLSDEGGGFDVGLQGLRAAIRATDGRGPPTALVAAAMEWSHEYGASTVFDAVYCDVRPKERVAGFAKQVLQAAAVCDVVAGEILDRAATEIRCGMAAVGRPLGIDVGTARLTGSMVVEATGELSRRVVRQLELEHPMWEPLIERRSPIEVLATVIDVFRQGRDPRSIVGDAFPAVRVPQ